MYRPIIAITMGDAAGVGPEIIMKSLATKEIYECCRPVVVGDSERLREAGAIAGVSLQVNFIQEVAQAGFYTRSEVRRVGEECVRTCISQRWQYTLKKKTNK